MTRCFFVSDLHGKSARYQALYRVVEKERPDAVFLGGDLFSSPFAGSGKRRGAAIDTALPDGLSALRKKLGEAYPRLFVILGNDDGRAVESAVIELEREGLWEYAHGRIIPFGDFTVCGYAYVPPTPFRLKDWERYDVSRFVDPGSVPPEDGQFTAPIDLERVKNRTIRDDLEELAGEADLSRTIFLCHAPPYDTPLDRAALDGRAVDHAPLDLHVGSIALARFIQARQPLITLHGHIHESARLTGAWRVLLGRTHCYTAAHDGPELALVRFSPEDPAAATRELR